MAAERPADPAPAPVGRAGRTPRRPARRRRTRARRCGGTRRCPSAPRRPSPSRGRGSGAGRPSGPPGDGGSARTRARRRARPPRSPLGSRGRCRKRAPSPTGPAAPRGVRPAALEPVDRRPRGPIILRDGAHLHSRRGQRGARRRAPARRADGRGEACARRGAGAERRARPAASPGTAAASRLPSSPRSTSSSSERTTELAAIVDELHELGVQVKDLDSGLVDFPSRRDGERGAPLLAARRGRGRFLARPRGRLRGPPAALRSTRPERRICEVRCPSGNA